jgi:hypothetical protein
MGMTWHRVQRVAFALGIVGALAMASGANWIEQWLSWAFGW